MDIISREAKLQRSYNHNKERFERAEKKMRRAFHDYEQARDRLRAAEKRLEQQL